MGAIFYKARIEGLPTSKLSTGGFEFTLTSVTSVEGIWPSWLSPQYRDP